MTRLWPEGEGIEVDVDDEGAPLSFTWRGQRRRVQGIAKRWRVDEGWWRNRVWREYFKLATADGLLVLLYRDLLTGDWRLQRLYD